MDPEDFAEQLGELIGQHLDVDEVEIAEAAPVIDVVTVEGELFRISVKRGSRHAPVVREENDDDETDEDDDG